MEAPADGLLNPTSPLSTHKTLFRYLINHFHKWIPISHSFVFMLIRLTALALKQKYLSHLLVVALKQKNILFDPSL